MIIEYNLDIVEEVSLDKLTLDELEDEEESIWCQITDMENNLKYTQERVGLLRKRADEIRILINRIEED